MRKILSPQRVKILATLALDFFHLERQAKLSQKKSWVQLPFRQSCDFNLLLRFFILAYLTGGTCVCVKHRMFMVKPCYLAYVMVTRVHLV